MEKQRRKIIAKCTIYCSIELVILYGVVNDVLNTHCYGYLIVEIKLNRC